MKRSAPFAVLLMFLGLWMVPAWAGDKTGPWDLALNLVPQETEGAWKPAKEGITGWEILPFGVVEITAQELMAISGGGPFAVPGSGDAPGKIILWDEFRPQSTSSGLQTGNYGLASESNQQNLIIAVGR